MAGTNITAEFAKATTITQLYSIAKKLLADGANINTVNKALNKQKRIILDSMDQKSISARLSSDIERYPYETEMKTPMAMQVVGINDARLLLDADNNILFI